MDNTNLVGRRCQILERRVNKDASADELLYGKVLAVDGDKLTVSVGIRVDGTDATQHVLPRKHVNVAEANGRFANSLLGRWKDPSGTQKSRMDKQLDSNI